MKINYDLVQFDANSQSFANKWGIQETCNLVAVYSVDGDLLTAPGGVSATWTQHFSLIETNDQSFDNFWHAVSASYDIAAVHGLILG